MQAVSFLLSDCLENIVNSNQIAILFRNDFPEGEEFPATKNGNNQMDMVLLVPLPSQSLTLSMTVFFAFNSL